MSNKSGGERLPSSPSHHKSAKSGGAKSSSKASGSDQNENSSNSPSPPVVVLNEFLAETYENLFNFKNESLFTDVQIYVDGVEFPCHKVILCATSSYFRAMFTCDLKEARHGKVYIENISPWTMKRLLDFIYTGRIEISPDNVIDLFNAALLFQLHALVDKCTAYIQANIDLANCVEVNLFASMHQLASLEACSFKFMLENFMHLVHLSLSGSSTTTSNSSSSSSSSHHHHHKAHHPANTPTSLMNALLNDQSASAVASKSASTATCSPPSSPSAFSSHSTSSAAANNELSLSDNLYSSFVRLNEQTFSELLKSDHLNVTREIYAYYALVKWLDYNTEMGKSTTSELHERLFANLRLNALNRDELEFIVKHDKYVRANAPLHATLKRHVYHNGQANSQPVLAQQQQPQQQQQQTVTTPQQTAQQLQQIQSQTSSLCVEDEARSSSGGVNSSGIGSSIIREVSSSAISSLARPSTIPRDYLCHLTGDRFEVYDFYKSKWSTLSPWPPSPPTTSPKKPHLNGGYSTCCLNNNLYVIGGYIRPSSSLNSSGNSTNNNDLFASASASAFDSSMSPPIEPVDWLYKYDPIANEWSLLKPMLRPRAFHLSLCLCTTSNGGTPTTTSSHKENFILLFYGITSDYTVTDNVRERSWSGSSSESTSNPSTTGNATSTAATNRAWSPRLVQCLSIDLYNVQTDQWSELKISDNSLLNHHIFHLYYQYNRAQLMTLSSPNTAAAVAAASSSIPSLIALIRLQLVQSRSICALKNLIYIVNEDCIHCYQLKDDSLACLPYFRLPFNLNQFILGGAVSASLNDSTTTTTSTGTTSANEVVSLFSWFSDSDEPVGSISSSSSESPTNEFDSGAIAAASASASDDNPTTSTAATTSTFDRRLRLKKEKEAVIYLINPTKSLVYEFYPAKNKLKKLPTLLLRHHNSEASIININSKLYVTGGYLTKNDENSHHVLAAAAASSSSDNEESDESSTSSDGSAIEVYDVTSNAWSIFMSKLSTPMIGDDDEDDLFGQLPVIRKFFKLKISIA